MDREGAAVTCDGRLFHGRAAATGNTLSPTVDRRVRRTSRDVDEAERSRRLVDMTPTETVAELFISYLSILSVLSQLKLFVFLYGF